MPSAPKEIVSKSLRYDFREYLSDRSTLRGIKNLFENHHIKRIESPVEREIGGQRRNLVEDYYASIDWTSRDDCQKILMVFEDILFDANKEETAELSRRLNRGGFIYKDDKILSKNEIALFSFFTDESLDDDDFSPHIRRMIPAIKSDYSLALGSAKDLIETVLKRILHEREISFSRTEDIPSLLKKAQKALGLNRAAIDDGKKGAEKIKATLSNLGAIACNIAELRNLYGTGHGRIGQRGSFSARHAKLVAYSSVALCVFLLETHNEKKQREQQNAR